jgi:hypothetical protein
MGRQRATWSWSDVQAAPSEPAAPAEPKPLDPLTIEQREWLREIEQGMLAERKHLWLPWLRRRDLRLAALRREYLLDPEPG